jgi:phage terminase small subunit
VPAKAPRKLTPKQARFCAEYAIDLNATQAARRAGYSARTCEQLGYQLLQNPSVTAEIKRLMAGKQERTQITSDRVLSEIYRLAMVDVRTLFNEDGTLKPLAEWPEDGARAVGGIEVDEIITGKGAEREVIGHTKKLKLWPKMQALEALGKHLRLFADVHVHEGEVTIADRLKMARAQARKSNGDTAATS